MDIEPGQMVKVTVTSQIKTTKAKKTLGRIFLKDKSIFDSRNHDPKPVAATRRAGRIWPHRPRGSVVRPPEVGDTAQVRANVDVIRDLQSVAKYIKVD